jgi:sugar O-acyltransferase (sialic acid O-acetyltransferase NeuD family)
MSRKAVIIGYSGHAYVVLDILLSNQFEIIGYYDRESKSRNPYDLKHLGREPDQSTLASLKNVDCFMGIGSNGDRARIFTMLMQSGIPLPAVAHKNSSISPSAQLKHGTVVMAGAVINPWAQIGNAVICNSASVIEHECEIADYVHIAPGAVLAGNVKVGARSFIGANAVIKQGITIGSNVTVGAGAVVVNDIPDNTTVVGNPGRSRAGTRIVED